MSLYKYCPPERLDILKNARICFSAPSAFNDPFEMLPFVEGAFNKDQLEKKMIMSSLEAEDGFKNFVVEMRKNPLFAQSPENALREFFNLLAPHLIPFLGDISDGLNKSLRKTWREALTSGFNSNVGVLCLSEEHDNLLMWGHYAHSHQGIAIEFDETHPYFDQRKDQTDEMRFLQKVKYSDERPRIYFGNLNYVDLCLTKSEEWVYENEWRMVLPLKESAVMLPNGAHLFDVPRSCITGVIIGCRASDELKDELVADLNSNPEYCNVEVLISTLHEEKFGLEFHYVPRFNCSDLALLLSQVFAVDVNDDDEIDSLVSDMQSLGLHSIDSIRDVLERYISCARNESIQYPQQVVDKVKYLLGLHFGRVYQQYKQNQQSIDSSKEEKSYLELAVDNSPALEAFKSSDMINSIKELMPSILGMSKEDVQRLEESMKKH